MLFRDKLIATTALAVSLFAFTSIAYAGGTYFPQKPASTSRLWNFYIGSGSDSASIYERLDSKTERFDADGEIVSQSISFTKGACTEQVYFHLIAGMQSRSWCSFNLAAEISAAYSPNRNDGSVGIGNTFVGPGDFPPIPDGFRSFTRGRTVEYSPWLFVLALMPGYHLQPNVTLYGKIGYTISEFVYETKFNLEGTSLSAAGPILSNYDKFTDVCRGGIEAGIGLRARVSDNISIRYGYDWDWYKHYSLNFKSPVADNGQIVFRDRRREPENERFESSVIYHFCPANPYYKTCPVPCAHEFYAGISGTRDAAIATETRTSTNRLFKDDRIIIFNDFYNSGDEKLRGFGYQFYAGYTYTLPCGPYVGAEVFYHNSCAEFEAESTSFIPTGAIATNVNDVVKEDSELKYTYGLDIVGGYKFSQCFFIYGKLGVAYGRFHNKIFTMTVPEFDIANTRDDEENICGYRIGIGMEVRLCNNVFLRNEFMATRFNHFSSPRQVSEDPDFIGLDDFSTFNDNQSGAMTLRQYSISLEYRFQSSCCQ